MAQRDLEVKVPFIVWAASLCDIVSALEIIPDSWQGKAPKAFGILWGFSNFSCLVDIMGKKKWDEARVSVAQTVQAVPSGQFLRV